jgi:hypothetical protein
METPFEGTVLENITFKKRTVSEETLKWAIEGGMQKRIHKVAGLRHSSFQKENSCHRLMLKILLARSIISRQIFLFMKTLHNMDTKLPMK